MEMEEKFELEANMDFKLDLDPDCIEEQASLCQSPSQLIGFLFSNSNPLSENNSSLFSNSTNQQNQNLIESDYEIKEFGYSAYCQIGGKRKMQDKITIHNDEPTKSKFFGIFDGFGDSSKISHYLSEQLHSKLFETATADNLINKIKKIVNQLHQDIDQRFSADLQKCGSTALFAILTQQNLIIVNLGDSRAVLYEINENYSHYQQLSTDHSANNNQEELDRIEKSGGFIFDMRGIKRVQGELAVTRAFTNNEALAKFVAVEPEINIIPLQNLNPKSKYHLILASDGLWNELSNQDIQTFLHNNSVDHEEKEENISRKLYDYCLKKNNYIRDNISIINVNLQSLR